MLPDKPTTTPSDDASTTSPASASPEAQPVSATGENPHVDYNLHPLKVASLEHYVEQPDGVERFRIS